MPPTGIWYPTINSSSHTLFQSYTLPVIHSSNHMYTLALLHSYTPATAACLVIKTSTTFEYRPIPLSIIAW